MRCCSGICSIPASLGARSWSSWSVRRRPSPSPSATSRADADGRSCTNGLEIMNARKAHEIWIEQCEAAQTIRARFGLEAAFDYLVGEKLLNFAEVASRAPDLARELPRFVSEVRRMFTPEEIGTHLARIE